jgi:hypothetical protein
MNYKLLYKKQILVKYISGILYKLEVLYDKNLFIMHSNVYRHNIWNYKKCYKKKLK